VGFEPTTSAIFLGCFLLLPIESESHRNITA
jgi:hypothetical protein